MSDLDRVTGIKHLRVRGMRQVSLAATLKATGLNIPRATVFRIRKRRPKGSPKRANSAENVFVLTIPERFKRLWNDLIRVPEAIWFDNFRNAAFMLQAA